MPFKTADELGLTEEQRCALVKTLVALENKRLARDFNIRFDMEHWGGHCGSACCIGGSAEALGGLGYGASLDRAGRLPELHKLFYPSHYQSAWGATQTQAAVALRHYLTTGKENWKMAMETKR